jgi:predicted MFS family arabinose efflux permease
MMRLGVVYLVFAPSLVTTLLAGRAVALFGVQRAVWLSTAVALAGLPLLLGDSLPAFLAGLALVACGTFAAQAAVTGFVGRAATTDRGAASGIYLACYFAGGLVGSAVLGPVFDRVGWEACVAGIAIALGAVAALAFGLRLPAARLQTA